MTAGRDNNYGLVVKFVKAQQALGLLGRDLQNTWRQISARNPGTFYKLLAQQNKEYESFYTKRIFHIEVSVAWLC